MLHPVLEANTVTPLREPLQAAHQAVREAEELLGDPGVDVEGARETLARALRQLDDLDWFYLPMVEVREDVLDAYREQLMGRPERRDAFLQKARRALLSVAERSGPQLEKYIEELLELESDAEARAAAGEDPGPSLERLAEKVDLSIAKGRLVLGENHYHAPQSEGSAP